MKDQNTPTNTLEEIKATVKDGLSNHSGEFANPWIFKGSYSHELLADILNDIMNSERLFKNLEKLIDNKISQAVNKARIEEMKRIKETWGEAVDKTLSQVPFKFVSLNDINKRIRELETPNQEEEME